jgi:hypothetical protein
MMVLTISSMFIAARSLKHGGVSARPTRVSPGWSCRRSDCLTPRRVLRLIISPVCDVGEGSLKWVLNWAFCPYRAPVSFKLLICVGIQADGGTETN